MTSDRELEKTVFENNFTKHGAAGQMLYNINRNDVINHLKVGTVLWRSVSFHRSNVAKANKIDFKKTDKGSYCCRVVFDREYIFEPVIVGQEDKGIIVFTQDNPPENWTHLVLAGYAMNRRSLLAYLGSCMEMDKYIEFRLAYFQALQRADNHHLSPTERLDVAKSVSVELPERTFRSFVSADWGLGYSIDSPIRFDQPESK